HPRFDDPAEHLEFEPDTGVLKWKTERGERTISILGLNRVGLTQQRKAAYQECRDKLKMLAKGVIDQAVSQDLRDAEAFLADYDKGAPSYMRARRSGAAEARRLVAAMERYGR